MGGGVAIADALTSATRDGSAGDSWRDECGVFGIVDHEAAAELSYYALFALQHRGEESAGIASSDGTTIFHARGMGLLGEAISERDLEHVAAGTSAIGHVRYSTAGACTLGNAQPLVFRFQRGNLALAHNGNLINARELRGHLEHGGAIFQTTSDTEVIAHLVARRGLSDVARGLRTAMRMITGGYALCVLTDDALYALRDPHGLRPLALGRIDGSWCVASESCAFNAIGAEFVRDVEPGELVSIRGSELESRTFARPARRALCSFEHIYFARPDSDLDGQNVHEVRKRCGERLLLEHPAEADIVIGVPDSSTSAAMGYAAAAGLPYEIGLIKSHYIGRSFIQPSQELRARGVRLKLNPVRRVVEGRRVVMVDDSLVRGTTSSRIVGLLRSAGARAVHVRIASPPVAHPCHYGIDTARRIELIAATSSVEQITEAIGADSLAFLSEQGLLEALSEGTQPGHCNACFTGRYPTPVAGAETEQALLVPQRNDLEVAVP